jgi:sugar phosphate isomerase/epimerase
VTAFPAPQNAPLALGAMCFRDRSFATILDAAAASGFTAIGLTVGQCVSALERGIRFEQLPELIRRAGLRVAELELVRMADVGATRYVNDLTIDLAGILAPDRVHAAAFAGEPWKITDDFTRLCERLAPTAVGIEFMPYSNVANVPAALDLLRQADQPNGRIVLDVLHFFRSGAKTTDITADLISQVACVQLSDVAERPAVDLAREARHLRTYPGRGQLDIVGFLAAIQHAADVPPPLSVEPVSDALETLPLRVVAEETMLATLDVLAKAGYRSA